MGCYTAGLAVLALLLCAGKFLNHACSFLDRVNVLSKCWCYNNITVAKGITLDMMLEALVDSVTIT